MYHSGGRHWATKVVLISGYNLFGSGHNSAINQLKTSNTKSKLCVEDLMNEKLLDKDSDISNEHINTILHSTTGSAGRQEWV